MFLFLVDRDTKNVIQVFKEKFLMAEVLPEYLSEWTTNRVDELGVKCIGKSEVEDFVMKDGKLFLILTGNEVVSLKHSIIIEYSGLIIKYLKVQIKD